MLRFMDWSVVAMGCALVLASLGGRWWERTNVRKGAGSDHGRRFFWAWLPLLMGLGMIGTNVPRLLGAPYSVMMILDTLNLVLAITTLFLALRAGRHFLRTRGLRTLE
ncbi:hypothetical protein OG562_29220 [Streptomyces sp. NBC_01275]|uniref:hypothetical protein n=1 Tax=Streptomyces sp. NBC_01275 TaxID=2903807 RepID=UPI0022500AB3|nr:hypothetical protein [Streptomyces sp. NBC_01275]MCX4764981.1 hypothetical protein [Streptomyces sp. NBC_01275]